MKVYHPQELNTKAELKFNKLKTQAKGKIASLQAELDKYKMDQTTATDTSNIVSNGGASLSVFLLRANVIGCFHL